MIKDELEPRRYQYLDYETSNIYDCADRRLLTLEQANEAIKNLIERLAQVNGAAHASSRY